MGKTPEASENCRKALAIRESLMTLDSNDARYKTSLEKNYVSLANILAKTHEHAGAADNYRRALAIQQSLVEKDSFNVLVARDLVDTQSRMRALQTRESTETGIAAQLLP
jgi:hypothetical protein